MVIICRDSEGFEDLVQVGQSYPVKEVKGGSYLVLADNGEYKWLGSYRFSVGGV